jgi:hypothetical protein
MAAVITQQELYKLVLQYFKKMMSVTNPQIQMLGVIHGVDQEAKFLATGSREGGGNQLSGQQHEEIAGIVWDLIVQGIVTFTSQGYPWLRITEYGKKVAEAEVPVPYDPAGYLDHIKTKAAGVSELALEYIQEAIKCFRGGAYRATAVMLGVASEEGFLQLISAFEKKYGVTIIPDKFKPFQQLREDFKKRFEPHKNDLLPDLKNNIEQTLNGIYDLIKKGRDDSGHPTDIEITREEVLVSFSVLPLYLERVQKIINFYNK